MPMNLKSDDEKGHFVGSFSQQFSAFLLLREIAFVVIIHYALHRILNLAQYKYEVLFLKGQVSLKA